LSPRLFNVYINDLINELRHNIGVEVFAFADDIALIADSLKRLKEGIRTITAWCRKNKMMLNRKKSKILFVPKSKHSRKNQHMKGEILGIAIVKKAKYLGIILDRNLMFKEQMEKWKMAAR